MPSPSTVPGPSSDDPADDGRVDDGDSSSADGRPDDGDSPSNHEDPTHHDPPDDADSTDGDAPTPSRRRLLAAVGGVGAAATAGCAGSVPGVGVEQLATETRTDTGELSWRFPRDGDDGREVGYAELRFRRRAGGSDRLAALEFNATVVPDGDLELDRYRARVGVPPEYARRHGSPEFHVSPPSWGRFRTESERAGAVRGLSFDHRGVDTAGSLLVPVVVDAGSEPFPTAFTCEFAVWASESGWLGRRVVASDRGRLSVPEP